MTEKELNGVVEEKTEKMTKAGRKRRKLKQDMRSEEEIIKDKVP